MNISCTKLKIKLKLAIKKIQHSTENILFLKGICDNFVSLVWKISFCNSWYFELLVEQIRLQVHQNHWQIKDKFSPLLHLHRRGYHEREKCICPLSFLWKEKYTKNKTDLKQLLHNTQSIKGRLLHREKNVANSKDGAYWKTPCTPGCLVCPSPQ